MRLGFPRDAACTNCLAGKTYEYNRVDLQRGPRRRRVISCSTTYIHTCNREKKHARGLPPPAVLGSNFGVWRQVCVNTLTGNPGSFWAPLQLFVPCAASSISSSTRMGTWTGGGVRSSVQQHRTTFYDLKYTRSSCTPAAINIGRLVVVRRFVWSALERRALPFPSRRHRPDPYNKTPTQSVKIAHLYTRYLVHGTWYLV